MLAAHRQELEDAIKRKNKLKVKLRQQCISVYSYTNKTNATVVMITTSGNNSNIIKANWDILYFLTAALTNLLPWKINKWLENLT